MSKRVLILGVGSAQADAMLACRARGHRVFAISYRDEGKARELADEFAVVDIANEQAVLAHAKSIAADVVYSVGSDVAMPTVAHVSAALGLPHFVDVATTRLLQNKAALRAFLTERGLSTIAFRRAGTLAELADWSVFPAILKPVDSQGQRGVREVASQDELPQAFEDALAFSRSKSVIVEEYIDGPEISVNGFIVEGNLAHAFVSDRYSIEGLPGGIVRGHALPSRVDEDSQTQAKRLVRDIVDVLGLKGGPFYVQLKCSTRGVVVIEAAARLDGCHLWRLIQLGTGVDLLALTFDLLEGKIPVPSSTSDGVAKDEQLTLDFLLAPPGKPYSAVHQRSERDLYFESYYAPGEIVRPINGLMEKVGYHILRTAEANR